MKISRVLALMRSGCFVSAALQRQPELPAGAHNSNLKSLTTQSVRSLQRATPNNVRPVTKGRAGIIFVLESFFHLLAKVTKVIIVQG